LKKSAIFNVIAHKEQN